MYQALYRKWRPVIFEDVLGQEHITGTLKNQIVNKKLSHAYLFSGTRGTGKTSTAKILSRAVNCLESANGNPCNACAACLSSLNGSAVDIIEIDAASNNKVDDVRIIRDEVVYTPAELKYKVYIIDEAHMLTNQAFNALLKTLEEPPPHIIFVFATTEPHKFPPTILSRCQRFDFKRITPYDTEKRIKQIISQDGFTISDDAVSLLCRIADGSMRDALSILDQCLSAGRANIEFTDISEVTGASDPRFIYKFAENLINTNLAESFKAIKEAYENGRDLEKILDDLILHFRNVLITKTLNNDNDAIEILMVSTLQYNIYKSHADMLSLDRILRYIDLLSEAVLSKKHVSNPRLCAEIAITGILKKPDVESPEGMLEKLMELESRVNRLSKGEKIPVADKVEAPPAETLEVIPDVPEPPEDLHEECQPDFVIPTIESPASEPILEEAPAPAEPDTELVWDDIITLAAKNADFGFKKIITSGEPTIKENSILITIENPSYLSIAKMNKYDEIIKKVVLTITGIEYSVRLASGKAEEQKQDSNYDFLLGKLEKHSENISFFD